ARCGSVTGRVAGPPPHGGRRRGRHGRLRLRARPARAGVGPGEAGGGAVSPRWCVVGPTHPFRGGIPLHTTLMAEAIAARGHSLNVVTFTRQYPGWLYKGASDRDPEQLAPVGFAPERRLDSVGPRSWRSAARAIADQRPEVLVGVWW